MSKKGKSGGPYDDKGNDKPGFYRGEKLKPGVTDEFLTRVEGLDTAAKRNLVVEIQKQIDDAKVFLATNEEIQRLKNELDLIQGPSQETIRHLNNRTKFLVDRLKEIEPSTT